MTSIILNVFSYLIWPSHPLRAILIGGCQSQPVWALPSHASPPPIDAAFLCPGTSHTIESALLLTFSALAGHTGLSLGGSPPPPGIGLSLHPSCGPQVDAL